MAKYDKETKFYWLQLKEDFFENDAIEWLEEQKPNGREYAYFYLKLCLKSLKSNGILIRKVGNILIPYDNRKLAELTKVDFDTVTVAMELLKKIGLVQILENGEIYVNQLENLIGSKSIGAFKKQQQRLMGGQRVDKCPPKIDIELDIEKDIELDIEKDKEIEIDIEKEINKEKEEVEVLEKWQTQFEEFYSQYPRKVKKQDTEKWFKKNKPNDELFEIILNSLEQFKTSKDWTKDNGQFIPYPTTWLNQHRWEDENIQPTSSDITLEFLKKEWERS